jgi:AcrR family transcriptional regulator
VALLWGGLVRPSRGPKPALTLDAVVDAAIAVADRHGLPALTMHRVAAALDVSTMALYRHVPGKEELIDVMVDRALGPAPRPDASDWRAGIVQWARASLAVLQRHPWLLESIVARVAIGPAWLGWIETALKTLAPLGLTAREQIAVVVLVDGHVRAVAQTSLGATASPEWAASFNEVLQQIRGDGRYAALAGAAASGGFGAPAKGEPSAFEFGLQRILDGVEAFSRGRSRTRRRST